MTTEIQPCIHQNNFNRATPNSSLNQIVWWLLLKKSIFTTYWLVKIIIC